MKIIIRNEKDHAEKMMEEGFLLNKKMTFELGILFRYYKSLGVDKEENERKLHDFCKFWLRKEYNYVKFIKIINGVANFNKNTVLAQGRDIVFSKNEMRIIVDIENEPMERLLFIIMFLGKVDGFNYCNAKDTEIFRLAHVVAKMEKRDEMMHWLSKNGYLSATMTGGIKVLVGDPQICKDTPLCGLSEDEIGVVVERFEDPVLYLKAWRGDSKVKVCVDCGGLMVVKGTNTRFCVGCSKKRRLEGWKREYDKRRVGGGGGGGVKGEVGIGGVEDMGMEGD
jgi:hypothetical protein